MKGNDGRGAEIRELQDRYSNDKAQFVAVYGRRNLAMYRESLDSVNLLPENLVRQR
jgi:hypothetical protein